MEMFRLSVWPPEVLCNTTEFLDGSDVGRLWLCGDSVLCSKLKFGGVTKFEIDMKGAFGSFWPCLASEFTQLRRLSVKSMLGIDENALEKYLSALSPKVSHLELKCFKLGLSWFTGRVASSISNLTSLKLPMDAFLSISKHLHLPVHLETLQCGLLQDSMLSELPHLQLTSLTVAISNSMAKVGSLSRFTALKSLNIQGTYTKEFVINALPPSLTVLQFDYCTFPGLDGIEADFRFPSSMHTIIAKKVISLPPNMIPPSLTHLEFSSIYTNGLGNIQDIQNLPPTMRHLSMKDGIKPHDLIKLPASLTYLQCEVNHNNWFGSAAAAEADSPVPKCPPNLTTLVYRHVDILPFPILPDCLKRLEWGTWEIEPTTWPEQLETFKATAFDRITVWTAEQRLTKMDDMIEYRKEHSPFLPPTITELDLFFKTPTQLYLLLPSALTSLRIDCGTSEQPIGPSTTQLSLFMEEDDELPQVEDEEESDFYERQFPAGWARLLPKTLKELSLNVPHRIVDDQWVDDLNCPELRKLFFLNPIGFSSAKIPSLPLSIEDLTLKMRADIDWSQIQLNQRRQLRVLSISTQSKFINFPAGNDAILPTLPPRLVMIVFRNAPISQEQKRILTGHHIHTSSY